MVVYNADYGGENLPTKKDAVDPMSVTQAEPESLGLSNDSLNTEGHPAVSPKEGELPCLLCKWFTRRMENTQKEFVKHVEKFHMES